MVVRFYLVPWVYHRGGFLGASASISTRNKRAVSLWPGDGQDARTFEGLWVSGWREPSSIDRDEHHDHLCPGSLPRALPSIKSQPFPPLQLAANWATFVLAVSVFP